FRRPRYRRPMARRVDDARAGAALRDAEVRPFSRSAARAVPAMIFPVESARAQPDHWQSERPVAAPRTLAASPRIAIAGDARGSRKFGDLILTPSPSQSASGW